LDNLSLDLLQLPSPRAELKNITVTTATDGNHGRAVAWSARQVGCPAVIYMPRSSTLSRIEAIRFYGAEVQVIEGSYDEAFERAREDAEVHGRLLIQDSSWPGYETIPTLIMQGYLTLMDEVFEQLSDEVPTHVFIQCGVGSFAAAVLAYLVERFGDDRPIFAVVEPTQAACCYESLGHPSGLPQPAGGSLDTIMTGLACGRPSHLAWDILKAHADGFISCSDWITEKGMIRLGCPAGADARIISGESGAVSLGLLEHMRLWLGGVLAERALQLGKESKVLLVSTEGATDPDSYRRIVGINNF
jgi:diaminopropionate ammonia-lyase